MADGPAISAADLVAIRGRVAALRGVDLDIETGEAVAVVGPSGSGKTTLIRCLAGLDPPTTGTLRSLGVDLHDAGRRTLARYRARAVGVLEQHYVRALSPDLKVIEIVSLSTALLGMPPAVRTARGLELLEQVGLRDRAAARRSELSGGEQQRVAVCAALGSRPRLLLADEPTGELDPASAAALIELIVELVRSEGTTVVVATHDLAVAGACDRALTMRDGRIVAERLRGGEELLVIDGAGVVRIPPELRTQAGLGSRAAVGADGDAVQLRSDGAAPDHATDSDDPDAAPARPSVARPRAELPSTGPPAVVLSGVSRTFGTRRAVDELCVELEPGRFHALVGPSGSGKTTVLHLIAGLERPSAGSVTVLGTVLDRLVRAELAAFRRGRVAVTGQSPALVPFLTAAENAELGALAAGKARSEAREQAIEALAFVGLEHRAQQRAAVLSGGEQHRLSLARALAGEPALLLADEPTASLDQAGAAVTADLLAAAAQRGTTVVCATHDPLVADRADRRLALAGGRLA